MNVWWALAALGLASLVASLFVWAMCAAAADADRRAEEMRWRRTFIARYRNPDQP